MERGLPASCAGGVIVLLVQIEGSYGSDEMISLEGDVTGKPTKGHDEASATTIRASNSSTSAPAASYVHCVSASNPVCPPNICPSIKSCPRKKTNEPIMWGPV